MGALSIWHILISAVVAILLFGGRGKISDLMGDVAKGINSFKKGLNDPEDEPRSISSDHKNETVKDTDKDKINH